MPRYSDIELTSTMIEAAKAIDGKAGRFALSATKRHLEKMGMTYEGDDLEEARKMCKKRCNQIMAQLKRNAEGEADDSASEASAPTNSIITHEVEDDDESASITHTAESETITIAKSDWEALVARVAALEEKPIAEVAASAPKKERKPAKARTSTKDVVLTDILNDGEKVYSKELINAGDKKGEYRVMSATFVAEHKGFLIDGVDNRTLFSLKREYALSPTTLCSRFRAIMKNDGECAKGSSTCCGFAKCYVIRDDEEKRLNTLW